MKPLLHPKAVSAGARERVHRDAKDRLYGQFARIGKAVASPHRLEMLELLAQGDRSVESLAAELGTSMANTSRHLQALRQAALVESHKHGLFVFYRLADAAVSDLTAAIRAVAERRLADLERIVDQHFSPTARPEPVHMQDLLRRARSGQVVSLDARPATEYAAAHIAGAISIPIDELQQRLKQLPKGKRYVAYCRGPYCVYADEAVEMLRAAGRRAQRMLEGVLEWRAAGLPLATGPAPGRLR